MDVINIIKELEKSLSEVEYINQFQIIKDETKDIPDMRDNIQDYVSWVSLANMGIDFSTGDNFEVLIGVSGVSTKNNEDYLQVVSKCLYGIKKALIDNTYVKEKDINPLQITIDSEEKEDSIIIYCYTSFVTDVKLAYGSKV